MQVFLFPIEHGSVVCALLIRVAFRRSRSQRQKISFVNIMFFHTLHVKSPLSNQLRNLRNFFFVNFTLNAVQAQPPGDIHAGVFCPRVQRRSTLRAVGFSYAKLVWRRRSQMLAG